MKDEAMMDTTLIVYAFDKSEPKKREICKSLLEDIFKGKMKFFISNQILGELYVVLTKKIENPIPKEKAEVIVNGIIESEDWIKINYTEKTVKRAMKTSKEFKIHFWDAVISETMLENGIFTIYTENEKDFKKVPNLKVVNPLK